MTGIERLYRLAELKAQYRQEVDRETDAMSLQEASDFIAQVNATLNPDCKITHLTDAKNQEATRRAMRALLAEMSETETE